MRGDTIIRCDKHRRNVIKQVRSGRLVIDRMCPACKREEEDKRKNKPRTGDGGTRRVE